MHNTIIWATFICGECGVKTRYLCPVRNDTKLSVLKYIEHTSKRAKSAVMIDISAERNITRKRRVSVTEDGVAACKKCNIDVRYSGTSNLSIHLTRYHKIAGLPASAAGASNSTFSTMIQDACTWYTSADDIIGWFLELQPAVYAALATKGSEKQRISISSLSGEDVILNDSPPPTGFALILVEVVRADRIQT
ncbi:hypothetical protein CHS0354_029448 [Potamilus streckersoni]|uniref:BED-type domain-containing protein n=1 Tax=Potamilus streckersoni TaxID=2493646 RepID=A0AAE0STR1_9BIVA|nr:hypothetical protein CHS0354_029448 [Potamilus streckersoni]